MSYNKPAPQFLFQNHLQVSGDSDKYLLNCSEKNVPKKKISRTPSVLLKTCNCVQAYTVTKRASEKKNLILLEGKNEHSTRSQPSYQPPFHQLVVQDKPS